MEENVIVLDDREAERGTCICSRQDGSRDSGGHYFGRSYLLEKMQVRSMWSSFLNRTRPSFSAGFLFVHFPNMRVGVEIRILGDIWERPRGCKKTQFSVGM